MLIFSPGQSWYHIISTLVLILRIYIFVNFIIANYVMFKTLRSLSSGKIINVPKITIWAFSCRRMDRTTITSISFAFKKWCFVIIMLDLGFFKAELMKHHQCLSWNIKFRKFYTISYNIKQGKLCPIIARIFINVQKKVNIYFLFALPIFHFLLLKLFKICIKVMVWYRNKV